MTHTSISGFCPMGCGQTLNAYPSGVIRCEKVDCPDPLAVSKILADPETEHVVEVDGNSWIMQHPLRERIGADLFGCEMNHRMTRGEVEDACKMAPGRYRVIYVGHDPFSSCLGAPMCDWEKI